MSRGELTNGQALLMLTGILSLWAACLVAPHLGQEVGGPPLAAAVAIGCLLGWVGGFLLGRRGELPPVFARLSPARRRRWWILAARRLLGNIFTQGLVAIAVVLTARAAGFAFP